MNQVYVNPNLKVYEDFESLINDKTNNSYHFGIEHEKMSVVDLLNHKRLFVLAEPGYGKSQLLEKIVDEAKIKDNNAVCIELKNIDLKESLLRNIEIKFKRPETKKTDKFCLINSENTIVCLDALDEVNTLIMSEIINKIKDFLTSYDKVKVFVSCRDLYFSYYKNQFIGYDFKFTKIDCFNRSQIVEYLKRNEINDTQVSKIEIDFLNSSQINVIQTPRYLNLLVRYIKENTLVDFSFITRSQLFEYFIFDKLNKEKEIQKKVDVNIIKRMLETLALTMEIYQVNKLTKDELSTFFADIQNDLKINILGQIPIDEFINNSILKNNIDVVEFDNTEFQEYLAAKELSRFSKLNQSVFDLAVNKDIREVYPSWFNVLSYLIELKPELLNDLLEFGMHGDKLIVEEYFRLITGLNANLIENEIRNNIFKQVFKYYQDNKLTIEGKIVINLSYYYSTDNYLLIKEAIDSEYPDDYQKHILYRNIFNMVYYIAERNKFDISELEYLTERYSEILKNESTNISLLKNILFLSKYLKSKDQLETINKISGGLESSEKDLNDKLLISANNIDPNSEVTFELITKGIEYNSYVTMSLIFEFNSYSQFKKLFEYLMNNKLSLDRFLDRTSNIYNKDSLTIFLQNIEKLADEELLQTIKNLILISCRKGITYNRDSKFLHSLIKLMAKLNNKFIFELIDEFSSGNNVYLWELPKIFRQCLSFNQMKAFNEAISKKFPEDSKIALNTFYGMKYESDESYKLIFDEGRKYYPDQYKEFEKQSLLNKNHNEKINEEHISEFKNLLNISTDEKYYPGMFSIYSGNQESIEDVLCNDEKTKFLLILKLFLKKFNPSNSELSIEKSNGKETSYTTNSYIQPYGEAILCADLLGIDSSEFRSNILSYIPFAYDHHLKAIFNLVGEITESEAIPVIDVYKNKKDDQWRFMPLNFLNLVETFNFKHTVNIVKEILNSYELGIENRYLKEKALTIIDSFQNNQEYLKDIFKKYEYDVDQKFIAEKANYLLILNYCDKEAIEWRMDEIIKRAAPFEKPMGSHTISNLENELDSKPFASPLMQINEDKYLDLFLDLIDKSYEIQKNGLYFERYADYIRDIVFSYFSNLKISKNITYINKLEEKVRKYGDESGYGWTLDKIRKIKYEYPEYIGKQTNIHDCIKIFNKIKNADYIDIYSEKSLSELLKSIIKNELSNWINIEGHKLVEAIKKKIRPSETELQKLFKLELENILLRKGFRSNEIFIHREVQSLDDKKPDFLIGYGFLNPVLIELKLSDNSDLSGNRLKEKESYKSFNKYIKNFKPEYSIFLVYENQERQLQDFENHVNVIREVYGKLKNVDVIGIP